MSLNQIRLKLLPPFLLGICLIGSVAHAQPKFKASEFAATNTDLIVCDLDGDGLKDLVLVDGLDLSIFYQDAQHGFTPQPQQIYQLDPQPCAIWSARLGKPAESLLVMTSDGVTELCFTNRTSPPTRRQIIRQPTIIPESADETNVMNLSLSVVTGGDWPLLLVPAADGIQVWRHEDDWRRAQVIGHSVDATIRPSIADPGYTTSLGFDLSVNDVNGDGREDLMTKSEGSGGTNVYRLYLQQANGRFNLEPALTYEFKPEWYAWLGWNDFNRDGKVDLIKGVWLNEPSFIPGVPSGKVLVSTFLADAQGRIPAKPQQLFRKNDWISAVPVLDVDGDGFPDLVLGYHHLDNRESLVKEITARRLDYSLRFYFYRPGTGFPRTADCECNLAIHLDHGENPTDWNLPENFERYVKLGGDFMGDGKTDLLVRDQGDAISAYSFISREAGFSKEPVAQFNCPEPIDQWLVMDLNHDGISDLIVKLEDHKGYRIFISQK